MLSKSFGWFCLLACIFAQGCASAPPSARAVEGAGAKAETARVSSESPRAKEEEKSGKMEDPPPPPEPEPSPETTARVELPPPRPTEVAGAVERVFKGAAVAETARRPYFVVGDFNGDSSQDLAVLVRPAPGKAAEINDELSNWILVAPQRPPEQKQRPLAAEGEVLVAVIHGFGAKGWRDPQATQTYVLKDAAGESLGTEARGHLVKPDNAGRLPRLRGDVIAETLGGRQGFLYYDGARYSWYDPRTYRPPAPARLVHGGQAAPRQ